MSNSTPSIVFGVCGFPDVPRFANAGVTDIVSIATPGQFRPDLSMFTPQPNLHRIEFDDVCHDCLIGPTAEIAQRFINLSDNLIARSKQETVRVLYHCAAGISRSTAALFILLVRDGATYEQAYSNIIAVRGIASPNLLLIRHADILMQRGGKMLDFIANARQHHREDALEWVSKNPITS